MLFINFNLMKKLQKEYKLNVSINLELKYGSINREDPKIIYINGRAWIEPLYDGDYESVFKLLISQYKKDLNSKLHSTGKFERNMVYDFDINPEALQKNKKKFLSFDVFMKQTGNYSLKELSDDITECVGHASDVFVDKLLENEFSVTKTK